jgi:predicted nucleic acid-binding protein
MKPIVIDASAAAAWVMPDEARDSATDLYVHARSHRDVFHAPQLWPWEVGNILVMGHRRKRISAQAVEKGLKILAAANINLDVAADLHRQAQVSRLALTHDLTYYDAAYLELVLRLNGQLASLDAQLLKAAHACGIVCLSF